MLVCYCLAELPHNDYDANRRLTICFAGIVSIRQWILVKAGTGTMSKSSTEWDNLGGHAWCVEWGEAAHRENLQLPGRLWLVCIQMWSHPAALWSSQARYQWWDETGWPLDIFLACETTCSKSCTSSLQPSKYIETQYTMAHSRLGTWWVAV